MIKTTVIKTTILLRRDILANWQANNPVLQAGEMGFATDVGRFKIGDGVSYWNDLPYFALETDINKDGASIIIKTAREWAEAGFVISKKGTFYIYTENNEAPVEVPKIKIGDGLAYICDLPFVTDNIAEKLYEHINNPTIHVSQEDRHSWDKKVTAYMHETQLETLVLDV